MICPFKHIIHCCFLTHIHMSFRLWKRLYGWFWWLLASKLPAQLPSSLRTTCQPEIAMHPFLKVSYCFLTKSTFKNKFCCFFMYEVMESIVIFFNRILCALLHRTMELWWFLVMASFSLEELVDGNAWLVQWEYRNGGSLVSYIQANPRLWVVVILSVEMMSIPSSLLCGLKGSWV